MQTRTPWNAATLSLLSYTPEYGTGIAWEEHIPFVFSVIEMLRPKLSVELGSYTGLSHRAVCDGVTRLGLPTQCHAFGNWRRTEGGAEWGQETLAGFRLWHDPLYGHFSKIANEPNLVTAASAFADDSIDILHFTARAVSEAQPGLFEAWIPKMSSRGVMLVSQSTSPHASPLLESWRRARQTYFSFEFTHAGGIGMLAVGCELPAILLSFLAEASAQTLPHRNFFESLGRRLREHAKFRLVKTAAHGPGVVEQRTGYEQMRARVNEADHARDRAEAELRSAKALSLSLSVSLEDAYRELEEFKRKTALLEWRLEHIRASRSWKIGRGIVRPAAWLFKPLVGWLRAASRLLSGRYVDEAGG